MDWVNNPEKIKALLVLIDEEKKQKEPDKKWMRRLFDRIWHLSGDERETYTGQDAPFQVHTSMRTFEDQDEERR